MGRQIMAYPYNGLLLSNEKLWSIDMSNNMGDPQNTYAEWKTNEGTRGMILST